MTGFQYCVTIIKKNCTDFPLTEVFPKLDQALDYAETAVERDYEWAARDILGIGEHVSEETDVCEYNQIMSDWKIYCKVTIDSDLCSNYFFENYYFKIVISHWTN